MKLHELEKNIGATHRRKKVGRGPGSGLGKTSGKGHKGQKSRSGVTIPATFEGGQMPLFRKLPKRGFSNHRFKKEYAVVNLDDLNIFEDGTLVTPVLLREKGIINKELEGVKILARGELKKKLTVQAHKFSLSAKEKIEKSGSKIEVI